MKKVFASALFILALVVMMTLLSSCGGDGGDVDDTTSGASDTSEADVTSSSGGQEDVYVSDEELSCPFNTLVLPSGSVYDLRAAMNGIDDTTTFSCSSDIATVSEKGIVSAISGGETRVTAEKNGVKASIAVTVQSVRPASTETIYVNDYASSDAYRSEVLGENELKMHFIEVGPIELTSNQKGKSASFCLEYNGEFWFFDSGDKCPATFQYIMSIRKALLESVGKGDCVNDTAYKIRLNFIPSHFHTDHVGCLIKYIIPSQYIEVGAIYAGDASANAKFNSSNYQTVINTLRANQNNYSVQRLAFGETFSLSVGNGDVSIKLYGAPQDWGLSAGLEKLSEYYGGESDGNSGDVENANSIWARVVHGENSFLFTGDPKKGLTFGLDGEPFDMYIEYYGVEEFVSDVLVYPHHGINRKYAFKICSEMLLEDPSESTFIFTVYGSTSVEQAEPRKIHYYNTYDGTVCATSDGTSITWSR